MNENLINRVLEINKEILATKNKKEKLKLLYKLTEIFLRMESIRKNEV